MNSLILRTATAPTASVLLLFSIFMLLRGHDLPGGGFIGGLIAGGAMLLFAMGRGIESSKRAIQVGPEWLVGVGLSLAVLAGLIGLFVAGSFLTGLWWEPTVPGLGVVKISTPLLFDIGVYLLVAGMTMTILTQLEADA